MYVVYGLKLGGKYKRIFNKLLKMVFNYSTFDNLGMLFVGKLVYTYSWCLQPNYVTSI